MGKSLIYRGILIEKGDKLYLFRIVDKFYKMSRMEFCKLMIDEAYKKFEGSKKELSVCEFDAKNNTVFDWGNIRAEIIPEIASHTVNSFLIIENERSEACNSLIEGYLQNGAKYWH